MTEEARSPLVASYVDLRTYAWMPLEFRRLFASDTWVLGTAEEKVACLHLWCEAWHQIPAGSLPSDDRILAKLSATGSRWKRLRDHALRGWVLCSDGRWYHPFLADRAVEAYSRLSLAQAKGKAGASKRWSRGNAQANGELSLGNSIEGKGIEGKEPSPPTPPPFELPPWIPETNWAAFVEMRNRIKKPLTEFAKRLVVLELAKLQKAGEDPVACLDQSTRSNWQDVYRVKDKGAPSGKQAGLEARNADVVERFVNGGKS